MTKEDAISILYGMRSDNLNFDDAYTRDKYMAIDMAIKALEQESTLGKYRKCGLNMDFETVKILLMALDVNIESNINDFKVFIYSTDPLSMCKSMVYGDIPNCFNCKVNAFDIDLDKKIIFIRSEVVKHGKI